MFPRVTVGTFGGHDGLIGELHGESGGSGDTAQVKRPQRVPVPLVRTVDDLLFGQGLVADSGDELLGFDGGHCAESVTASAFALILQFGSRELLGSSLQTL